MTNMLDYISWRGDIPFSSSPFNEIDNIIYSMLSFIDFSGLVPRDPLSSPVKLSECLEYNQRRYPDGQNFGAIIPRENNELLKKAAESKRFEDTYITAFRDEIDEESVKQFAAVTFILPDNSIFVAFRGTDDTFVGWREDLAMSYDFPTTSQRAAADYLTEIALYHSGPIRTGGHSKGGNLSVYSAVFSPREVKDRIITAYNNDGPGFTRDVIESDEYKSVSEKIYTVVPQSSIVGMFFEATANLHVIESTATGGAAQHNPYTWIVLGKEFRHLDAMTKSGQRLDSIIDQWIAGSTPDERRKLTDTIFSVLESAGAKTLSDFNEDKLKNIAAMIKAIAGFDKETRDNVILFIKRFADAARGEK